MFEGKSSLLCRLCLKSGGCPIDIFDPKGTNGYLVWKIIKEFTEIETSRSDGMPPTICEDCMKKLMDFKYFKKMCIDSRIEFLLHEINNGLVVPMTEDESGPSAGDLHGQGDDHTRGTWNNLEAEGIESEVPIKMEEVDLNEQTENVSPDSIGESMENEHSELADVKSQVTVEKERDECEIHLTPENDSTVGDSVPSDDEVICLFHASVSEAKEAMPVKSEESQPEIYLPVSDSSGIGDCHSDYEHQSKDAIGSVSEVAEGEELSDQDDLHLHLSSSSSDEEECVSNVSGKESKVTGVNCTDVVGAPVDGVEERLGQCEETLGGDKDTEGLEGTGHKSSAPIQQDKMVPGATQSYLKQRRLTSHSRDGNYCPNEETESNPCNTSGKQFGVKIGRHTQRNKGINTEREHGNGPPVKDILIGSSVRDDKPGGQDLMCDKCGQGFKSKVLIERHVKFPCVTDASECGICNKKFCTKHQYKRHKSLHCVSNVSRRRAQIRVAVDVIGESESQIKKRIPHTCNICSKTFSSKGNLKMHIKTVHLMERNFSCEICGKAFGQKQQLKFHMAYHTGVKPYICSHCQKGFSVSGNLRKHIRAVHEMEKPHTCGECGKVFSLKQNLMSHILLHTGERPHTCVICSRSFSHKHHLESHTLIHTGGKPHTCTLCSKTFRHNRSLKRHMATHAEKVPH